MRRLQSRRPLRIITLARTKTAAGTEVAAAGTGAVRATLAESSGRNEHFAGIGFFGRFFNTDQRTFAVHDQTVRQQFADNRSLFVNDIAVFQNIAQIFAVRRQRNVQ